MFETNRPPALSPGAMILAKPSCPTIVHFLCSNDDLVAAELGIDSPAPKIAHIITAVTTT